MATPHENPDEYTIHGIPRSFFTRKLQAAMGFYGLPYRTVTRIPSSGDELSQRAQTHQIPILECSTRGPWTN